MLYLDPGPWAAARAGDQRDPPARPAHGEARPESPGGTKPRRPNLPLQLHRIFEPNCCSSRERQGISGTSCLQKKSVKANS